MYCFDPSVLCDHIQVSHTQPIKDSTLSCSQILIDHALFKDYLSYAHALRTLLSASHFIALV